MAAKLVHTMLSEALEDEEKALELMRSLPGVMLCLPDLKTIEAYARDRRIFKALSHDPSKERVGQLAAVYSVPRRVVAKSWQRTSGKGIEEERRRRAIEESRS